MAGTRTLWPAGLIAALAAALLLALSAAPAGAVTQSPKNGCQSETIPTAYHLTSPSVSVDGDLSLSFWAWWEVETIDPFADEFKVEISYDGGPWTQLVTTPEPFAPPSLVQDASDDLPISNMGFDTPAWQEYVASVQQADNTRIRFEFGPRDELYNGFRGVAIDDVKISDGSLNTPLDEDFEDSSADQWSFTGYWQVKQTPQLQHILSPDINPTLVTLPFNDVGNLPAPRPSTNPPNTKVAWYGENRTGTFCGADFDTPSPTPVWAVSLDPATAARQVGETHTVLATGSLDGFGLEGIPLGWSVSGANPQGGTAETGPDGSSAISWTGTNSGVDTLTVFMDDNFNGAHDVGEAAATSTVSWTQAAPPQVQQQQQQEEPPSSGPLPPPQPGRSVNVTPQGTVRVKFPRGFTPSSPAAARAAQSNKFVTITEPVQIPTGSTVDTRKGAVDMESAANLTGGTQKGNFSRGLFKITQRATARPFTSLRMRGGSFNRCGSRGARAARVIRRLRGSARGRYRTRGRRSSATVRGTVWTMTETCAGTLTTVQRGKVAVRDFGRKRTVTLRKGDRYLARPKRSRR